MTTIRCKACNEVVTSRHAYDFQTCQCPNRAHVCGTLIGAYNLDLVEEIKQPKPQKGLGVGKHKPRKRKTKLNDVEFK